MVIINKLLNVHEHVHVVIEQSMLIEYKLISLIQNLLYIILYNIMCFNESCSLQK